MHFFQIFQKTKNSKILKWSILLGISTTNQIFTPDMGKWNFHVWIGLSDTDNDNKYTWNDKCAADYLKFAQGEPNDQDGLESCTQIIPNKNCKDTGIETRFCNNWNDVACSRAMLGFVCKK